MHGAWKWQVRKVANSPFYVLCSFFTGWGQAFGSPALTNILKAEGLGAWIPLAFAVVPACSIVSPVIGGAIADEKMAAQRLFGWCSLMSGAMLIFAFGALHIGLGPWWFLTGLAVYAISSGPTWGLLATIGLTNLTNSERQYPLARLGATLGWIAAGFITSYVLRADASPATAYAAGAARIIGGLGGVFLPNTPPLGIGRTWRSALGLGGFVLFKTRNHAVLFLITGLYSIPLVAFYMYSPELFSALGDLTPTASMTVGQWSEVIAMLFLGAMMVKYRLKTMLLWGLGLSALRFGLSGLAGHTGVIFWHFAGVALHGLCFTLYFVTAQVYLSRRVELGLRSRAQGMLGLMQSGLGPLIGAFFCGWLRDFCVDENGQGWDTFWWVLAAIITVCTVAFASFYRGKPTGS